METDTVVTMDVSDIPLPSADPILPDPALTPMPPTLSVPVAISPVTLFPQTNPIPSRVSDLPDPTPSQLAITRRITRSRTDKRATTLRSAAKTAPTHNRPSTSAMPATKAKKRGRPKKIAAAKIQPVLKTAVLSLSPLQNVTMPQLVSLPQDVVVQHVRPALPSAPHTRTPAIARDVVINNEHESANRFSARNQGQMRVSSHQLANASTLRTSIAGIPLPKQHFPGTESQSVMPPKTLPMMATAVASKARQPAPSNISCAL